MHLRVKLAAVVATVGAAAVTGGLVTGGSAQSSQLNKKFPAVLTGYQESPNAISTTGVGLFEARLDKDGVLRYRLTYRGLEGNVTHAHIHFGNRSDTGGISAFLCSNLGNGPAGTPECPPPPAVVDGVIRPEHVVGPEAQGIESGAFDELLRAMRAEVAYANVHSTKWPSGEIRGQLGTK